MGMTPIGSGNVSSNMTSLSIDPYTVANYAAGKNVTQLQAMLTQMQPFQDQYNQGMSQFASLPPASMSPYGMMPPSTAFNRAQPYIGPSYYSGPSPYGAGTDLGAQLSQTLSYLQMARQYLQSSAGQMPYIPGPSYGGGGMISLPYGQLPNGTMPSPYGDSGMMPSPYGQPGGGLGGLNGLSPEQPPPMMPGETREEYQAQLSTWQKAQQQKAIQKYDEVITQATTIMANLHNLAMSIIQNMSR